MRRFFSRGRLCLLVLLLPAFIVFTGSRKAGTDAGNGGVTIVYTNDIHSYIANSRKDKDTGKQVPGLRLSKVAKMVSDLRAEGRNVMLVDCGDEVQGNVYGSYDKGASIIDIMNKAGYQLATPGNHDFDYGVPEFFRMVKRASFPYVSCNFMPVSRKVRNNRLPAYKIFRIGGRKIAFIGITTPETFTASSPVYFQDGEGNYLYGIKGTSDTEELYEAVQETIDAVKGKCDYIVALGHTGIGLSSKSSRISSEDIIANTSGLNAFIDGHSHSTVECSYVEDRNNNRVLLTQSGAYLSAVGIITVDDRGNFTSRLVNDYEGSDNAVEKLEDELIKKIDDEFGQKIATLGNELYVNNPDISGQRLIRSQELNAGDFAADSIWWYFNEDRKLSCDIAIINAGGIRSEVKAGDVLLSDVKKVFPFNNVLCLIKATGQQIKDALEMGVTVIGKWDDEWNAPAENGGFLHVAGMRYTVDAKVKSSVSVDGKGMFKSVNGTYRVKDIEIYNRETGAYEPLELSRVYTVGGINYILRNSGNGLSMFSKCPLIVDFAAQDLQALAGYMKSFAKQDGCPLVSTENCALRGYAGYQLDYSNPYGSGRITIEK